MKIKLMLVTGILLLMSAVALPAQNMLPDANNDACWQSLSSLHACELAQQQREMDYAQRCTSYPEYQCQPATEQSKNLEAAGAARKAGRKHAKAAQETPSPANGYVAVSAGSSAAN
jgi:hypothetical protein